MAVEVERMVAVLEARADKYEKALARAEAQTGRSASNIEGRLRRMSSNVTSTLGKIGTVGGIGGAFAGVAAAQTLIKYADNYRSLTNQLRVSGLEGVELQKVFGRLAASAKANFAPLDSLVTLYGRAAQASKELGASQQDLLSFADNVAKALRVAGSTPEAASGALLQLSQLLGSSRVQAEEFNSVNEGARPILQAVADGIQEAGGSVSKLKQLVTDGEVSNRAFFEGFQIGAKGLEDRLAGTETTVAGAMENLKTSFTELAGRIDKAAGASNGLVSGIGDIARFSEQVTSFFEVVLRGGDKAAGVLANVKREIDGVAIAAGRLAGLDNVGRLLREATGESDVSLKQDGLAGPIDRIIGRLDDLKRKRDEILRSQGENSVAQALVDPLSAQIEQLTEKLNRLVAARDRLARAGSGPDVARAIIDASPASDAPPVVIGSAPRSKPISVKDYPVKSTDAEDGGGFKKGFKTGLDAFIAAAKAAGHDISVASGFRSFERQAQLYAKDVRDNGGKPSGMVGTPEGSNHPKGLAADLNFAGGGIRAKGPAADAARGWAYQNAGAYGLKFPMNDPGRSPFEPWHVEDASTRGGSRPKMTDAERDDARRRKAVDGVVKDLDAEREAIGKTAEQRRLLQELQQAGVDLNSAEGQSIREKVAQLYAVKEAADMAAAATERLEEIRAEFASVGSDAAKGFVADLKAGKSAADALRGALDRIVTRLTDNLIDGLFANLAKSLFSGAAGGGGGLGLFGTLFGGGRAAGGPVEAGKAYLVGEKRPELFMPGRSGTIIPSVPKMAMAAATPVGGVRAPATVNMRVSVSGPMGDKDLMAAMQRTAAMAGNAAYQRAMRDGARGSEGVRRYTAVHGQTPS